MTYYTDPGERPGGAPVISVLSAWTVEEFERSLRTTALNMVNSNSTWRVDNITGWSSGGGNIAPQHHAVILSTRWEFGAEQPETPAELAVPGEAMTYDLLDPTPLSRLEGKFERIGEDLDERLAKLEQFAKHLEEKRSMMMDHLSGHDARLDRLDELVGDYGRRIALAEKNISFAFDEGVMFPDPAPKIAELARQIDDVVKDVGLMGGEISKVHAEQVADREAIQRRIDSVRDAIHLRIDSQVSATIADHVKIEQILEERIRELDRTIGSYSDSAVASIQTISRRVSACERFIGIPNYPTEGNPAVTPDEVRPQMERGFEPLRTPDTGSTITITVPAEIDVELLKNTINAAIDHQLRMHVEPAPTIDLGRYNVVRSEDENAFRSSIRAVGVDPDHKPRRMGQGGTDAEGS